MSQSGVIRFRQKDEMSLCLYLPCSRTSFEKDRADESGPTKFHYDSTLDPKDPELDGLKGETHPRPQSPTTSLLYFVLNETFLILKCF